MQSYAYTHILRPKRGPPVIGSAKPTWVRQDGGHTARKRGPMPGAAGVEPKEALRDD